ncbi:PEP-CTERM sorting domain-containing protein [Curvibacter sp. CHRR-16]|nr:PEP-CTERM sorting domain-containing protein [Curvibacter sp. CHRR-16]
MEKAKITATFLDGTSATYYLTAADIINASWTGSGSVTNLSPATGNTAGVWKISNPFGSKAITNLVFSAVNGTCKTGNTCSSQSDYTLMSVTAVPEAETYAMMLAGLGMVGAIVRRRKKSA